MFGAFPFGVSYPAQAPNVDSNDLLHLYAESASMRILDARATVRELSERMTTRTLRARMTVKETAEQ